MTGMQPTRGRKTRSGPESVDVHVGGRIRVRRLLLGLSQERLAATLGLTFQQIQKYEKGVNRVSASKLFELTRALDVPVSFFFEGLSDGDAVAPGPMAGNSHEPLDEEPIMNSKETLELLRAYYRIADTDTRKRLLDLIRAMNSEAV